MAALNAPIYQGTTALPGSGPVVGFADHDWSPPRDWQKFERLCHLLWMRIWQDPQAQMHGRPGQEQKGVDVFGTPKGSSRVHGIQCKRKDQLLRNQLTEKEVRAEVENAKAFEPPLEVLIIATCAPSDVGMQELARRITEENATNGLFAVHIFGWSEIVARMAEYPELIARHYGFQPIVAVMDSPRAETRHAEVIAGQLDLAQRIEGLESRLTISAPADGPAHAKLDACRALLEAHAYQSALAILETIRNEEWERADHKLRFRISTNLACAHLGLERSEEAGRLFLEAFQYDQQSDKALANHALGLLLLDRGDEATAAAREATAKHPLSANAWTAYFNVVGRVQRGEPLLDPPAQLTDHPTILLVRADMLAMRKDWNSAEALLRKLLTLPGAHSIARSRLAEVIMSQASGDSRFYAGASYSAEELARFREARDLLRSAWDLVKRTDLARSNVHVVNNACALASVLGEMQSAEDMLDEGLLAAPENENLWSWKVRTSALRGDGAGARRALDRLSPNAEDRAMVEATAARAAEDPVCAARVLEAWIQANADPDYSIDARCMFADSVCEGDLEHAEARFNALPHAGESVVARSTVIFARALREAGRAEVGETYLARARQDLDGSTERRDRLLLADALADFEEHAAAVAIYEKEISTHIDTVSLREYIRCLFALDQRRRLVELFEELPAQIASKPPYEYYRANLSLRIGEFAAARAALEHCLATAPDKVPTRILWADVCLRLDDVASVSPWLKSVDPTSPRFSVDQLLRLGPMLHHIGDAEAATRIFYAALRRFPQDPRTHLAFTGSVMFKGSKAWIAPPTVARADTAVTLLDEDGRERTYVLEDRAEVDLQDDEVSIHSELGKRLVGSSVGDVIVGHSSSLASHQTTITSIQHKFVHAARESMNAFNNRFPESPGLVGIKLPTNGTSEEQIEPILKALKEKSSRSHQIVNLYSRGLPIAAMGVMMGVNAVEAWQGLRGRPNLQIVVCRGSHEEREAAFVQLRSKKHRYLLDPIALIELKSLEALDVVEHVCGRLAVVQMTIEVLRAMLTELDLHPEGYLTMFERDNQYYRHEVTAKSVAAEKAKLQAVLEWAREHCEIVPAVPKIDPKPETAEELEKIIGPATYDTLLAAQGRDFILLSDDFHLRELALGEFKVEGTWIQAVLMLAARELGVMGMDHYNRAVSALTMWRHHFTSVSADQLFFAARRARWRISDELQALIDTLALTHSEIRSNANVVALFLKDIWRKGHGPTKRQARTITEEVLKGVAPGKTAHSALYFQVLRKYAEAGVIPRAAWHVIVAWYRAEFLPPMFGL